MQESGGHKLTEIQPEEIDKITKTPTFYHRPTTSNGKEFFYFRNIEDSIEGYLGRSIDNSTINRTKSFQIKTINGLEEFFANKLLQKMLSKLEGKYVKIIYIGDQQTPYAGHRRKIYRVFKDAGLTNKMTFAGDTETVKKRKDGPNGKARKHRTKSGVGAG